MYIKNAEKFLTKLNFIGDRTNCAPEDETCEYYLKINDELQLYAVTTSENDIMFISEHKVLNPHNKFFEDDYNNYEIISECVFIDGIAEILFRHNLISETYYKLFLTKQKLVIAHNEEIRKNEKDEIQEFIDWANESLYYMNETHENTIWASDQDIIEFCKIAEDHVK